jgi:hypothetical protein
MIADWRNLYYPQMNKSQFTTRAVCVCSLAIVWLLQLIQSKVTEG